MLHVIKYFAKALKVIENGTTRKLGYGFLFAFHSNYVYLVSHGASAHFYADDGQLHVNSLAADTDDAINCLQACVTAVEQWMKSNQLRLNPQKTQLIWLGSQQQLDKVTTTDIQLLNASMQYEISASQSTVGLRWPTTSPPFAVPAISGCASCEVLFSR